MDAAEWAGLARPYRIQSLLGRSRWSADLLRDLVRDYALEALEDRDRVRVVDDTGFLKKGQHSVGVARQYSGTVGRIENCQIGVFLSYASRFRHALIGRQLYLPKNWASDPERRTKAQVPEDWAFTTKPAMAREMAARTLDAGVPCAQIGWHTTDKLILPDNITLLPLPPKAPELNPAKNVWQFMRENWLSNRIFQSYDDILDHCCDVWNKLINQPWCIMSLGLRQWAHQ